MFVKKDQGFVSGFHNKLSRKYESKEKRERNRLREEDWRKERLNNVFSPYLS